MKITIILNGTGGVLDRAEITGDRTANKLELERAIHAEIAEWTLRPGDTIVIEGDEEAHGAF